MKQLFLVNKVETVFSATFTSLKHKNFRYFWMGQCISLIGTWMPKDCPDMAGIYNNQISAFRVGILGVCQFMPMMLFTLSAGVFVDRFPKKKILLLTQTIFMIQAFILTALTYFKYIEYWHVLILIAIFGLTQTVDMPARQSFFIEMVGRKDLMNAISLNSTIFNLARIIGPAISGIIMIKLGPAMCFFLNGLSYLAVLFGLLLIKTDPP